MKRLHAVGIMMAETTLIREHKPRICTSQKPDQEVARCRAVCSARKGSPLLGASNHSTLASA
jgi:hypothetical protein